MKIKVRDREYDLRFGIRFQQTLNEMYFPEGYINAEKRVVKTDFGQGMLELMQQLQTGSPSAISTLVQAALSHTDSKLTLEEIDDYILGELNDGKTLSGMCDDFLSLLADEPLVSDGCKEYLKSVRALQDLQKQKKDAEDILKNTTRLSKTAMSASESERRKK